eukprot:TRINITY_DN4713_c0_g1_i4.p1 TRINITY_DN4713_c0_g1~~TRINITY_DN4713_c0_g1_i4.p1  ORF type:complete len:727 (+),score=154.78 TRINITY_DN4713_c0_g1_i4:251-2431(+)
MEATSSVENDEAQGSGHGLVQLTPKASSRSGSPVQQLGWHMFEFQRQLGRGTSGTAELVRRKSDGMLLVMKVIQMGGEGSSDDSVNNEVKILTKLKHPHIIGYYGCFVHNSWLHILMDYADGGTLEDVINETKKQGGKFTNEEVVAWTCQLAMALKYTHSQCVLHRDLKQANIFLIGRSFVKLGDFGLARALSSETQLAETACGTPYYLSPELCLGKPYNQKSDCWALGCVIYELLTLRRPFHGKNLHAVVMKICHEECSPLPEECGRPLVTLVMSLLQKVPNSRPSMAEVCELPFLKEFGKEKLPDLLKKELARSRRSMRPHRRTNSDIPLGSVSQLSGSPAEHISTPVNRSSARDPMPVAPLTPLPPMIPGSRAAGSVSPVPDKIRNMFDNMKSTLTSPASSNSSPRSLEQLKPPAMKSTMSPVQVHPMVNADSPVSSLTEIDKARASLYPGDTEPGMSAPAEAEGIEGSSMFVSPKHSGSLVGIDRQLLAEFPEPSSKNTHIGEDKLQLEALARAARIAVHVKDRGGLLSSYSQCCCGNELVTWMVAHFKLDDRERVLPICDQLLCRKVITHSNGNGQAFKDSADEYYHFQEDTDEPCMNLKRIWDVPARDAHDVACSLQDQLKKVYGVCVSPDGTSVDYDAMKKCVEFRELELTLAELQVVELSTLSFREKLAFWINLYNIMCIHMILFKGPPDSKFKRWQMCLATSVACSWVLAQAKCCQV